MMPFLALHALDDHFVRIDRLPVDADGPNVLLAVRVYSTERV